MKTENDAIDLLPCPFCGEEAKAINDSSEYYQSGYICCTRCNAKSGHQDGKLRAIKIWNKRAALTTGDGCIPKEWDVMRGEYKSDSLLAPLYIYTEDSLGNRKRYQHEDYMIVPFITTEG